jgi:hypothetical protein
MTKIRCILPNASEEMNGIKFAVDVDGGVVSIDDVPEDMAALFLSIQGFEDATGESAADKKARLKAEKQALKDAAGNGPAAPPTTPTIPVVMDSATPDAPVDTTKTPETEA